MSVHKLFQNRYAGLYVGGHAGPNSDNGWECAVDIVAGIRPRVVAVVVGWGFDDPVPLRPWPQVWLRRTTARGNVTSGIAWLGLFATIGGPK